MSEAVMTITDDQFAAEVLEAERPVVLDFWAAWCPPCRVMDPIIAGLATERPDVRFATLDVDANHRTAAEYGVLSMPTLLVFRDGREVLRLVGARPKRRLVQELEAALGSPSGTLPPESRVGSVWSSASSSTSRRWPATATSAAPPARSMSPNRRSHSR